MKKISKILLSFSKSERIGLAVLLSLLALFIILPYLYSPKPDDTGFEVFKQKIDSLALLLPASNDTNVVEVRDVAPAYTQRRQKEYNLSPFDPNTADAATFEKLGFSPKQAASIINYRSKGAVFRTPDDFKKVYVVSPELFARLRPYIRIAEHYQRPPAKENLQQDNIRYQTREPVVVELNAADTTELQKVRGIGSYTALQIVKYRGQLGGFVSVNQLREIRSMTEERFEQIAPQITVDNTLIQPIDLQAADERTLKAHPYIGAYDARGIIRFRTHQGGEACTIDALIRNNILKADKAEKLRAYCPAGR